MSDLQFEAIPHDNYPWAQPGDRLLRILSGPATGDMVRVTIEDKLSDTNYDGVDDWIQALATGSLIDETTGELLTVGGVNVQVQHNPGVSLDELDAMEQTIADFGASVTEDMIFKVIRRKQSILSRAML